MNIEDMGKNDNMSFSRQIQSSAIPNEIFDRWMERLSPAQFMALVAISYVFSKYRTVIHADDIERLTALSRASVNEILSTFKCDLGILERFFEIKPEQIKEIICQKSAQQSHEKLNNSFTFKTCSWCKSATLVLQRHHYPKPSRSGGTETVEICASCHAEYHYLERSCKVTEGFSKLFDEVPHE